MVKRDETISGLGLDHTRDTFLAHIANGATDAFGNYLQFPNVEKTNEDIFEVGTIRGVGARYGVTVHRAGWYYVRYNLKAIPGTSSMYFDAGIKRLADASASSPVFSDILVHWRSPSVTGNYMSGSFAFTAYAEEGDGFLGLYSKTSGSPGALDGSKANRLEIYLIGGDETEDDG